MTINIFQFDMHQKFTHFNSILYVTFPLAPLDANTLAKVANGMCDNLLTSICRAWDFQKPIIFAPAMNTLMWEHPITDTQIKTLTTWGYTEIPPIEKILMCKDKGKGAMAEPDTIVRIVCDALSK